MQNYWRVTTILSKNSFFYLGNENLLFEENQNENQTTSVTPQSFLFKQNLTHDPRSMTWTMFKMRSRALLKWLVIQPFSWINSTLFWSNSATYSKIPKYHTCHHELTWLCYDQTFIIASFKATVLPSNKNMLQVYVVNAGKESSKQIIRWF